MDIIFLFSLQALKVWSLNGKKIIIFCKKLHKYWLSTYYNLLPLHCQLREMLFQLNPPTFLSKWVNCEKVFTSFNSVFELARGLRPIEIGNKNGGLTCNGELTKLICTDLVIFFVWFSIFFSNLSTNSFVL